MKPYILLFALIVALTNMIVNVLKNICEDRIQNPKRLVLIVSTVLCIITAVGLGLHNSFSSWYMWVGTIVAAIITGFIAAHVAMFGYDEAYGKISELIEALIGYLVGGLSK